MTNLDRVASEIKNIGLYDLILQDVQKIANKKKLSVDEIKDILQRHPNILQEYKQTNIEYNLSNIHLKDIPLKSVDRSCIDDVKRVNSNLEILRDIEKYTLDFANSSTLVIIFSVEFFVLFSVQYFIVLLNLKEWQWYIYTMFALSIVVAWWYAKKEQKKYKIQSQRFYKIYDETLSLIEELESRGCIKKSDLWIMECDEHV